MTSSEISHHPLLRHAQWSLLVFPDIINGDICQELSLLLAFLETTRLCEYLLPIRSVIFVKISHIHPTRSAVLPLNHSHVFLQIVPYYHCITLKPAIQVHQAPALISGTFNTSATISSFICCVDVHTLACASQCGTCPTASVLLDMHGCTHMVHGHYVTHVQHVPTHPLVHLHWYAMVLGTPCAHAPQLHIPPWYSSISQELGLMVCANQCMSD